MAKERAKAAMGGHKSSKKSSKHRVHRMHISHAANGGFIAQHEAEPGQMPDEMEQHAIQPGGLGQHVMDHMEDQAPAAAAAGPAAAAPAAGASAMPAGPQGQ